VWFVTLELLNEEEDEEEKEEEREGCKGESGHN
jgi:hypothetical protein